VARVEPTFACGDGRLSPTEILVVAFRESARDSGRFSFRGHLVIASEASRTGTNRCDPVGRIENQTRVVK